MILRINGAGVRGYETDVGSRTDVRVGWPQGMVDAIREGAMAVGEVLVLNTPNQRGGDANWEVSWGNFSLSELGDYHDLVAISSEWTGRLHSEVLSNQGARRSEPQTPRIAYPISAGSSTRSCGHLMHGTSHSLSSQSGGSQSAVSYQTPTRHRRSVSHSDRAQVSSSPAIDWPWMFHSISCGTAPTAYSFPCHLLVTPGSFYSCGTTPLAYSFSYHLLVTSGHWPSTGFVAIAIAIALAKDIGAPPPSVFGFGACHPCSKYYECVPKLFYGSNPKDLAKEAEGEDGHHPFATEAKIRQVWERMGVIRLEEPSCYGFEEDFLRLGPPSVLAPLRVAMSSVYLPDKGASIASVPEAFVLQTAVSSTSGANSKSASGIRASNGGDLPPVPSHRSQASGRVDAPNVQTTAAGGGTAGGGTATGGGTIGGGTTGGDMAGGGTAGGAASYAAETCTDGIFVDGTTLHAHNLCMSAVNVPDPWLSVTIPDNSTVLDVVLHAPSSCCFTLLVPSFQVWLGRAAGRPTHENSTFCGEVQVTGPTQVRDHLAM